MKANQLRCIASRVNKKRTEKENKWKEKRRREIVAEVKEHVAETKKLLLKDLRKNIEEASREGKFHYKQMIPYYYLAREKEYGYTKALFAAIRAEISKKDGFEVELKKKVLIHPAVGDPFGHDEWKEVVDVLVVSW